MYFINSTKLLCIIIIHLLVYSYVLCIYPPWNIWVIYYNVQLPFSKDIIILLSRNRHGP